MTTAGRRYHHGDVRSAALAKALERLDADGADAITMRAVASAVGVDHRALYRHFPDREAILSGLAMRGYEALLKAMQTASGEARPLYAAFTAHVRFALSRPHLHSLMLTRSRTAIDGDPALHAAVFAVLEHLMDGAHAALGGGATDEEAKALAFAGLSCAYGMVSLAATQTLMPRAPDDQKAFLIAQAHGVLDGQITLIKSRTSQPPA